MNRRSVMLAVAACAALTACDEEKRSGALTLAGPAPLRIHDQEGKTVEFGNGPLKVEFDAGGGGKFTVKLEQDGRSAKFSGKVPHAADWNFTVPGGAIGQSVDFASRRSIELYGPVAKRWGAGAPCGFNGRWETEEEWRKGNEDWSVSFADAGSKQAVGEFKSRLEGRDYLVGARNIWCRERHDREPGGGRLDRASKRISRLQESGVKFD